VIASRSERGEPTIAQSCPLCGSIRYEAIKRFDEGVVVGRCLECGLLYTPRRLWHPETLFAGTSLEQLRAYHEPLLNGSFEHYRRRAFQHCLSLITRHSSGGRMLDVGCADGFFLREARREGYSTTVGIEPNRSMAAFVRESFGLDVRDGRLDQVDLGDERFDVVTMSYSLEYLPEPRRDVARLAEHLVPGGVLFVVVPNGDYFMLRHRLEAIRHSGSGMGGAFTPPLRVVHYTLSTLRGLLEAAGLSALELTAFPPIDSIEWHRLTGLPLLIRAPWYVGATDRLMRRLLHGAGLLEQAVSRSHNHLSQSLVAIARPRSAS
jgi:SAM-dependent methyltransferase